MKNHGTRLTRTLGRIRLRRQSAAWQDFAVAQRQAIKCERDLTDLQQSLHEQNASARQMIQQGEIGQLGAYRKALGQLDERRDLCLSRASEAQAALNLSRRELLEARGRQKAVAILEERVARSQRVAQDRLEARASQEQFLAHSLGLGTLWAGPQAGSAIGTTQEQGL